MDRDLLQIGKPRAASALIAMIDTPPDETAPTPGQLWGGDRPFTAIRHLAVLTSAIVAGHSWERHPLDEPADATISDGLGQDRPRRDRTDIPSCKASSRELAVTASEYTRRAILGITAPAKIIGPNAVPSAGRRR
jgi:hypothetical protein